MTNTLVDGGNVATKDTESIAYAFITRVGIRARMLHKMVNLAKEQGVTVTGSYRYSIWTPRLMAFNIEFTGPRAAVTSLQSYISDSSKP